MDLLLLAGHIIRDVIFSVLTTYESKYVVGGTMRLRFEEYWTVQHSPPVDHNLDDISWFPGNERSISSKSRTLSNEPCLVFRI